MRFRPWSESIYEQSKSKQKFAFEKEVMSMDANHNRWIEVKTVKQIIISLLSQNITFNEAMKELEERSEIHQDKTPEEKNFLH